MSDGCNGGLPLNLAVSLIDDIIWYRLITFDLAQSLTCAAEGSFADSLNFILLLWFSSLASGSALIFIPLVETCVRKFPFPELTPSCRISISFPVLHRVDDRSPRSHQPHRHFAEARVRRIRRPALGAGRGLAGGLSAGRYRRRIESGHPQSDLGEVRFPGRPVRGYHDHPLTHRPPSYKSPDT
jgi:hypothetical protein